MEGAATLAAGVGVPEDAAGWLATAGAVEGAPVPLDPVPAAEVDGAGVGFGLDPEAGVVVEEAGGVEVALADEEGFGASHFRWNSR